MKVAEFDKLVLENAVESGTRAWIFGLEYVSHLSKPLLNIPLTEVEITVRDPRQIYGRGPFYAEYLLAGISKKTGRPLATKQYTIQDRWHDKNGLYRSQVCEIFLVRRDAELRYREYLAEKMAELDEIVRAYTERTESWRRDAHAPLEEIDAR